MQTLLAILTAATGLADGPTAPTFWMPQGASTVAPDVDIVFDVINWICYFFFALIVVAMVAFVWKYRIREREHRFRMDGPTHHAALEATYIIVPLLLSGVIFFFGFRGYLDLATPPANSYDINVTAKKWQWAFTYPNGAVASGAVEGLVVPAGRPVRVVLRADDVLHSFFIPEFRVKRDCVPGRVGAIWFQCDYPTGMDPAKAYNLFCAEYCGTDHSKMLAKVYVLEQAEFDEWLAKQANWIEEIPDAELFTAAGPRLYAQCSQCHSLDGTAGQGPSWQGIFDRIRAGTGKFTNGQSYADLIGPGKVYETPEDYIRDSILNPGKYVVQTFGNVMPTFKGQMSERKIEAVTGMMKHLDQFDAKGKLKAAAK